MLGLLKLIALPSLAIAQTTENVELTNKDGGKETITVTDISIDPNDDTRSTYGQFSGRSFSPMSIDKKVYKWDNNPETGGVCWVSEMERKPAKPSLRNCYTATESSCCNFVEDEMIGADYSSFIPEPCQSEPRFMEIQIFMCFACRGESGKYVIKAEPTKQYVETIDKMMEVQYKKTGIQRTFLDDLTR